MSSLEYLTGVLKQAGLRMTPQRAAICQLLAETDSHPTAAMIYASVRVNYPSLSLTTVYNTLDVLTELGAINALGHAGDDKVHYDADTTPHVNLACVSCHNIVDIESPQVAHINNEISTASGYKLLGGRVMYYGLCPACQQQKSQ
jgi:Fur family peroxide stress response transcriptional regulator